MTILWRPCGSVTFFLANILMVLRTVSIPLLAWARGIGGRQLLLERRAQSSEHRTTSGTSTGLAATHRSSEALVSCTAFL